jgi:hypothetical protein
MAGLFVAAAVVSLLQYLRLREPRLLPLVALFALLAAGVTRGSWETWGRRSYYGALGAGLVLMLMLSRRAQAPR